MVSIRASDSAIRFFSSSRSPCLPMMSGFDIKLSRALIKDRVTRWLIAKSSSSQGLRPLFLLRERPIFVVRDYSSSKGAATLKFV